jgi:pantoate kinase
MTAQAFCPGHVTALFYAPEPGSSPLSTGSRGAGVCTSLGARATVDAGDSYVNEITPLEGGRVPPVTTTALADYLQRSPRNVSLRVGLDPELPVGQGFGMSGAMTFAALVASEAELDLVGGDRDILLAHAHAAEVEHSTGLGDVVAQARGGIDVRWRQGLPPDGLVDHWHREARLLLAWTDSPLHTRSVLSDPLARQRFEAACVPRLEGLEGEPDLEWLLVAGRTFAEEAGLVGPGVRSMLDICEHHGRASQVMLGNSVFAVGDVDAMGRELGEAGFRWTLTDVDNEGVRRLA